jgi:hypothetical protein
MAEETGSGRDNELQTVIVKPAARVALKIIFGRDGRLRAAAAQIDHVGQDLMLVGNFR